jgi:hypothetical protein
VNPVLLYIASALTGLWGVAHLFATRGVVAGFGDLTADNRRIITMEWIVEGVALISTAAFVAVATAIDPESIASSGVYAVAIGTLVSLSLVSVFTGFRNCCGSLVLNHARVVLGGTPHHRPNPGALQHRRASGGR